MLVLPVAAGGGGSSGIAAHRRLQMSHRSLVRTKPAFLILCFYRLFPVGRSVKAEGTSSDKDERKTSADYLSANNATSRPIRGRKPGRLIKKAEIEIDQGAAGSRGNSATAWASTCRLLTGSLSAWFLLIFVNYLSCHLRVSAIVSFLQLQVDQ